MEGLAAVFSGKSEAQDTAKSAEVEVKKLDAKIGHLAVERDFLAKAPVEYAWHNHRQIPPASNRRTVAFSPPDG
jgi:hypothetical protein